MSSNTSQPFLPSELILSVIDWVIPRSGPQPIALPPSHPATKTLLSLCRASIITYPTARRLLYTHCLWISNSLRLYSLQDSISGRLEAHLNAPHRTRPEVPILNHTTSLYLSHDDLLRLYPSHLLVDFFTLTAPYIRHLVIDMPLREYQEDNRGMTDHARATLRLAFSQLTALETFCSVRDELFLENSDRDFTAIRPPVWSFWPNLKTLALYNEDVDKPNFWSELGKLKDLKTLVLTRADGLEYVDMKLEWRKHRGDEKRGLEIVLVNVASLHKRPMGREAWKDDNITVREVNVPISYYGDEDEIELCQEWVKRRMLRGEKPADWT